MQNNLFSIPEAAKYSSVSRWTIWKYVRSGELKASRTPGGHFRIHKVDLDGFMCEKGMYTMSPPLYSNKKVLIVDDEQKIQELFKKMLPKEKYQIETASNGFEAGTMILQFKPDLVILDLIMPGMDGFEVCKKIKERSDTSHIKILAITGYDTEENKNRIMAAGADGFMTKPINIEQLQTNIQTLLGEIKIDSSLTG